MLLWPWLKIFCLCIITWQIQFNNNHVLVVEFWLLFFVGLWSIYISSQHLLFSCERNETFWIINFLKLRASTDRPRIETLIQSNKRVFAISIFDNFQFNFCCFVTDSIKVVALSQSLSFSFSLSLLDWNSFKPCFSRNWNPIWWLSWIIFSQLIITSKHFRLQCQKLRP